MKKILVIEDEAPVRANIAEILELTGFAVISAEDGSRGIELARSEHPDLILCDIAMPQQDGYAVLNELRNDPATATTPFIFLSAKTNQSDLRHGMNMGADDYLFKPFTTQELLKAISARLSKDAAVSEVYSAGQRHTEQVLRATEYDYRMVLDQASDSIFISDEQGRYMLVNSRACDLTGYSREELLQLSTFDIVPSGDPYNNNTPDFSELEVGLTRLVERRLRSKKGELIAIEVSATKLENNRILALVRDIRERKRAEEEMQQKDEQLRQSQKMEIIGQLTSGVAHDFNNILTSILSYSDLVLEELHTSDPATLQADLDEIKKGAERAAALTYQLLAFSRRQVLQTTSLNINMVIENLERMLRRW